MAKIQLKEQFRCSKSWDNMSENACGRFCQSCQKTVIDFRQMSLEEIAAVHRASKKQVCGIYQQAQIQPKPVRSSSAKRWSSLLYASLFTFFFSKSLPAQQAKDSTHIVPKEKTHAEFLKEGTVLSYHGGIIKEQKEWLIQGYIKDEEDYPLIGVNIIIEGTTTGTVTDWDGKYELPIPDELKNASEVVLKVLYTAYESQQLILKKSDFESSDTLMDTIVLSYSPLLGEVVCVERPPLHKRIWYTIKGWFTW